MPTYTPTESFLRAYRALTVAQQDAFRRAVRHLSRTSSVETLGLACG
jgi:hypothetical protein